MKKRVYFATLASLRNFAQFREAFLSRLQIVNEQGVHSFEIGELLEAQWREWVSTESENATIEERLGHLCYRLCDQQTVRTLEFSERGMPDPYERALHELILDFRSQYFSISFCIAQYARALAELKLGIVLFSEPFQFVGGKRNWNVLNRLEALCPLYSRNPEAARGVIFEFWPWIREFKTIEDFVVSIRPDMADDYHGA